MYLSVLVPVRNEEDTIESFFGRLMSALQPLDPNGYECVFVDDGSTDRSEQLLTALHARYPERVRVVFLRRNFGKTAAIATGLRHCAGSVVCTIDCDLQYRPEDIPALLRVMRDDGYDAVFAQRVKRGVGPLREACSKLTIGIRNVLLGESYESCYFGVFSAQCAQALCLYRGFQHYIPVLLGSRGFRIGQCPVEEFPRERGRSKYGILDRAAGGVLPLLVVMWMKRNALRSDIRRVLGCSDHGQ